VPHGSAARPSHALCHNTSERSLATPSELLFQALSFLRSLQFRVRRCCRREADASSDDSIQKASSTTSKRVLVCSKTHHTFSCLRSNASNSSIAQAGLTLFDRTAVFGNRHTLARCCHLPRRLSFSQRFSNGMNHRRVRTAQKLLPEIFANGQRAAVRLDFGRTFTLFYAGTEIQSASTLACPPRPAGRGVR
jgi:hypothetical protein